MAEPAFTASRADRKASVPARRELPKSLVATFRGRSRAAATKLADCFSLNGAVVLAKYRASTDFLSVPLRQSVAASTAMVMLSSSQLHMAFSPFPPPPHTWPRIARLSLYMGM